MSRQMNVGATLRNGLVVSIALLLRLFAACGPDKPQPAPLSPRVVESKSATAADQSHKTDSIQIDNEVAAPAANRSVLDAGAPRTPVGSAKVAPSTAADQVRVALESELRARERYMDLVARRPTAPAARAELDRRLNRYLKRRCRLGEPYATSTADRGATGVPIVTTRATFRSTIDLVLLDAGVHCLTSSCS
jgi:hypothetical protein